MKILHQTEDPRSWVSGCLLEALHGRCFLRLSHLISLDSLMGKFSLDRFEPSSSQRRVREKPEASNSDGSRDGTFDDKKPEEREQMWTW